jgi:hypothetical protein
VYLRQNRVLLSLTDPAPLPVLFFGFGTAGTEAATVANLISSSAAGMACETVKDKVCNDRGTCSVSFQCACEAGWMGSACQFGKFASQHCAPTHYILLML